MHSSRNTAIAFKNIEKSVDKNGGISDAGQYDQADLLNNRA